MPSLKSDFTVAIKIGKESFSLNCTRLPDRKFLVKRGRSISKKMPYATLTDIFNQARVWVVKRV